MGWITVTTIALSIFVSIIMMMVGAFVWWRGRRIHAFVCAAVAIAILAVPWWGILRSQRAPSASAPTATAQRPDAGRPVLDCPVDPAACVAFTAACDQLQASDAKTVTTAWDAAVLALEPIIRGQPWMQSRFAWFLVDPVTAVTTACGFDGIQAMRLMTTLRDVPFPKAAKGQPSPTNLAVLLRDHRNAVCTEALRYTMAVSGRGERWSESDAGIWSGACTRLLGASAVDAQRISDRVGARAVSAASATAASEQVPASASADDAAAKDSRAADPRADCHTAMKARVGNAPSAWVNDGESQFTEVGLGLAACPPALEPWVAIGIADRAAFADRYVITFVNADAARGGAFARQHSAQYQGILRAWNLE